MTARDRAVPQHRGASVILPALLILAGCLLRLGMLGVDMRFHPDEALFAAQARLVEHDLLLRNTDLDKPPLTFFVTALSFQALGESEFSARLPNVLFSGLSLALLYRLAAPWNRTVAAAAMLLWALSPYDLAFAATAFTDVQSTFWILAACLLAVQDRWEWAGLAAALMFASKSNGLMFVPLIAALGIAAKAQADWSPHDVLKRLVRFVLPLLAGIALLLLWDLARAPRSFFDLNYEHNNPGRFIRSGEVWPRLEQWGHWLGFATGSPVLNMILLVSAVIVLVRRENSRAQISSWLIVGFGIAFLGWYWLIAFNTYDRYLHTLIPFLLLVGARGLVGLWQSAGARRRDLIVIMALIGAVMLPRTFDTLRGRAVLGGDQGQHAGIDRLAHYLNTGLSGEIVYDHWLNWELAYYLGEHPRITLVYMPLPEALAEELTRPNAGRYFVAPSPELAAPWLAVLGEVSTIYSDHEFVVYDLQPQDNSF